MAVADDIELSELLAILAVVGIGGYFVWKFASSATCILKPGAIPGITGASQSQVQAASTAASVLKSGGAVIKSCGSDFDYLQPCGGIVTEARHNALNYIWPWAQPVTYTCVKSCCYPWDCATRQAAQAVGGN